MKKKLLAGLLCLAMTASMFGCGKQETNAGNAVTPNQDTTQTNEVITNGNDGNEGNDVSATINAAERTMQSMILSIDYSEEAVLPSPENVYLFAGKLTLPIKLEDLHEYQCSSSEHVNGDEGPLKTHTLAAELEEKKDWKLSRDLMTLLYDKSYTSVADEGGLYLPSFNLGKTEESITVADCVEKNIWYLDQSMLCPQILGMTEDEQRERSAELGIEDTEEFCLKELINLFGNPNYLAFGMDSPADKEIQGLLYPDRNDTNFHTTFAYIGWIFEDYKLLLFVNESVTVTSEGEYKNYPSSASFTYFADGYNDFGNYTGKNVVSEFKVARQAELGDMTYYQRQERKLDAVDAPETEGTSETESTQAEETTSDVEQEELIDPDLDFSEEANDNYFYVTDCFQIVDNFYLSGEAIKGELHVGDEVYVQFSDGRVVSGQVTYMQIYRESVEVVNTGESAGVVISGITREDSDFLRPSVIITKQ